MLRRIQIRSGNSSWAPSISLRKLFLKTQTVTASAIAMAAYSTVGFHLMKRSSCRYSVRAPNARIMPSVIFCMVVTLRSIGIHQGGLHHGGGHQHAGGHVDVVELVGAEKQQDGKEIDQYLHAGLKSSEAEFMQ